MAFWREDVVIGFPVTRSRGLTMSPTSASRTRRIVSRITANWAEMDHAHRRMLEIQTGTTGLSSRQGRKSRSHAGERDTEL
jgi:hypothetical protein